MSKEVNDANFDSKVLKSSKHTPIIVFFWAPWSNPCQTLSPILEKLEKDCRGKFFLAKLNVDSNKEKSKEFAIRGIPAVKMFKDGKPVAEFVGSMSELSIRKWLDANL